MQECRMGEGKKSFYCSKMGGDRDYFFLATTKSILC